MKLKQYIKTLERGEVKKFAEKIGVSPSYLSNMASGISPVPPRRCLVIEEATEGVVTRAELRPEDWFGIWPDFKTTESNSISQE